MKALISVSVGAFELGMDVTWVLLGGLVVVVFLWATRRALDLIPLGTDRRELLLRVHPVLSVAVLGTFAFLAVRSLFGRYPDVLPYALLAFVVASLVVAWDAVRDVLAGFGLQASRGVRAGDHVRVGQVTGRVERLGFRAMVVETAEGDRAIIPNRVATREILVHTRGASRGGGVDGASSLTFQVSVEGPVVLADLTSVVRRAALGCHWSSIARLPEVRGVDGGLEITVFALEAERAPEVEARVRAALGAHVDRGASSGVRDKEAKRASG